MTTMHLRSGLPRSVKIQQAVDEIYRRGSQPSAYKVQYSLGDVLTGNLNGRDTRAYREEMEWLGYIKDKVHNRWIEGPNMRPRK